MDSPASIATPEGRNLPRDLIGRALKFLDPNERSINGRLVSRDAGQRLSQPHHRTARLRFPLPQQAVDPAWQPHLHRSFQQLTFLGKVRSLSVAAASGSFVNVQLAWGLLQPCVSLGLERSPEVEDAGAAAVRHGHLHLLPWLLMHDCPIAMNAVLEAAAEHCDLAGMQRVWELAGACCPTSRTFGHPHTSLAAAVARSDVDGVAKLSWLLPTYKAVYEPVQRERPFVGVEMLAAAAEGAATSGSLPVLQWLLQEHGLDLRAPLAASQEHHRGPRWPTVLSSALHHGHVAVANWLVDEAGCPMRQWGLPGVLQWGLPGVLQQLWYGAATGGSVE